MTSKDLKRMSRSELLQMLLALIEENERLKAQLEDASTHLDNNQVHCDHVGSLAEAALQINGVFAGAENAAQQYLQYIKDIYDQQSAIFEQVESEAYRRAESIIAEANAYREKCFFEADEYWNYVRGNVRNQMEEEIMASKSVKGNKWKR